MNQLHPRSYFWILLLTTRSPLTYCTRYRDVLLNVTIEGFDLIIELQLHFKDVLLQKETNHRTYEYLRTLGWEKVGTGSLPPCPTASRHVSPRPPTTHVLVRSTAPHYGRPHLTTAAARTPRTK